MADTVSGVPRKATPDMPLGIGSFLLYAQGPRADLEVAYLRATLNGSAAPVVTADSSPGFNITRAGTGSFTVTFPKCRFMRVVEPRINPLSMTTAGQLFTVQVPSGIDATTGTFTLQLGVTSAPQTPADTPAAEEIDLLFLLGF